MAKGGTHRPISGELTIVSVPSDVNMIYSDKDARFLDDRDRYLSADDCGVRDHDQERMALEKRVARLLEVERQQNEFGE